MNDATNPFNQRHLARRIAFLAHEVEKGISLDRRKPSKRTKALALDLAHDATKLSVWLHLGDEDKGDRE